MEMNVLETANAARKTERGHVARVAFSAKMSALATAAVLVLIGCGTPKIAPENSANSSSTASSSATATTSTATTAAAEFPAVPPPAGVPLPFPGALVRTNIKSIGQSGGQFTLVSIGEGPKTFDIISANDSASADVLSLVFSGLLSLNSITQQYELNLLESCVMNPADKSEWTLKFREGLKWSDGAPLTADDLLFAAEVIYGDKVKNASKDTKVIDDQPLKFTKIDDRTVLCKIAKPSASAIPILAGFVPIPKHKLKAAYDAGTYEAATNINVDPKSLVSSGPYRLAVYQSGERVVLERNPHYHVVDPKGQRLPYLDTIIMTYAGDTDAALLRFTSGQADGFVQPRPESIANLKDGQAKGNYTLTNCGPADGASCFWWNLKTGNNKESGKPFVDPAKQKWFADKRFRQALAYALDKESIIRVELRGLATSVWGLETPGNKFWYNPNLQKYPFDVAKANALLDEMGLTTRDADGIRKDATGKRVEFSFITNKGNKVRERVAALMQADWKRVGVAVTPQFIDFNALVTRTADTFDYEACLLGFGGGGIHPQGAMNLYKSSGRTHFWNPEQPKPETEWEAKVDAIAKNFNATVDINQQRDWYFEIQQIVSDHVPFIPLWSSTVFTLHSNRFGNVQPTALSPELMWNVDEFYVVNANVPAAPAAPVPPPAPPAPAAPATTDTVTTTP